MAFDFLKTLLGNPQQIKTIGAIAPSSKGLAREITKHISPSTSHIIELGPGTGVFTQTAISKAPNASLTGFELNKSMADIMKRKFPEIDIIHACAQDIQKHSTIPAEIIISGIPWANLPASKQEDIMKEVYSTLEPGGVFSTFAYVGPHLTKKGKAFKKLIESIFDTVEVSSPIMRNSPPAFVYHCIKKDS